jgi:glucose/arabinose dehydrogenase
VRGGIAVALVAAVVVVPLAAGARDRAAVSFRPFVRGLVEPVYVAATRTEPNRIYVVEQPGRIRIVQGGRVLPQPFLDIRPLVRSGGEQGLLSMAFPQNYAEDRKFYVDYTDRNGDTRVVEYAVKRGRADPSSARELLFVKQPYANHNGGQLQFGPDGLLYVGMGDGGSAGDPENRAQNLDSQLGKLLRINVSDPNATWAIAGYGLRNPWRFSFDRTNGNLWIGDVGQGDWEEIDFRTKAQVGRLWNYGWNVYEGRARFSNEPLTARAPLVFPVAVYSHSVGCSVTGGYVYRGSAVPAMRGRYVYGDYCSGRIWSLTLVAGKARVRAERSRVDQLSSFGEDAKGELYATSLAGVVYKLAG